MWLLLICLTSTVVVAGLGSSVRAGTDPAMKLVLLPTSIAQITGASNRQQLPAWSWVFHVRTFSQAPCVWMEAAPLSTFSPTARPPNGCFSCKVDMTRESTTNTMLMGVLFRRRLVLRPQRLFGPLQDRSGFIPGSFVCWF
jgi:hypothetical protein